MTSLKSGLKSKELVKASIFTLAISSHAVSAEVDSSRAYSDAQLLGSCAGMLEFYSQVQAAQGNTANAADLHQKANGWRIATIGALSVAGWKNENIVSTADSIYGGALASWRAAVERNDPKIVEKLDESTMKCLAADFKQEIYREIAKSKYFTNP